MLGLFFCHVFLNNRVYQKEMAVCEERKLFLKTMGAGADFFVHAVRDPYMALVRYDKQHQADRLRDSTGEEVYKMLCFYLNQCYHGYYQKKDDYMLKLVQECLDIGHFKAAICVFHFFLSCCQMVLLFAHDRILEAVRTNPDAFKDLDAAHDVVTGCLKQAWAEVSVKMTEKALVVDLQEMQCLGCVENYQPDVDFITF